MFVDVVSSDEFLSTLLNDLNIIEEKLHKLLNNQVSLTYGVTAQHAKLCDVLRVVREVCDVNNVNPVIRNYVINSIYETDFRFPGSGLISLLTFIGNFKNKCMSLTEDDDIQNDLTSLLQKTHRITSKNAFDYVQQFIGKGYDFEVFKSAIELAGLSGNINIEYGQIDNTIITSNDGYRFKLNLSEFFARSATKKLYKFDNCKAVCIDGVIETTSEIERIMYSSFNTSTPVFIFARGFSDDVCNTLVVNFNNFRLNIIPIVVNFDEVGVNQLNDIAIVTSGDVTSSIKGNVINLINIDEYPLIESISYNNGYVTIFNKNSHDRSKNQRDILHNKLEETLRQFDSNLSKVQDDNSKEFIKKIFNERLSSLSPSCVTISLGKEHKDFVGIRHDRIRFCLSQFNELCKFGVLELNLYDSKMQSQLINFIHATLKNYGITCISPRILVSGIKCGITNSNLLYNVGAWVIKDDKHKN